MIAVIGGWLLDHGWVLEVAFGFFVVSLALPVILAAYLIFRLAVWGGQRARHRWDLRRMRRRPARKTTASEQAVLDYLTIRTAWNQPTREEAGR